MPHGRQENRSGRPGASARQRPHRMAPPRVGTRGAGGVGQREHGSTVRGVSPKHRASWPMLGRPMFKRGDRDARYARRVNMKDDIANLWGDDESESVLVRIFARDALSNFGRQFERRYEYKSGSLATGRFSHGRCMDVVPL